MSVDAQGYFWLADPTTAAAAIAILTGLVFWLHRLTMADQTAQPAAIPVASGLTDDEALANARKRRHARRRPAA